jgi:hypothetical protein
VSLRVRRVAFEQVIGPNCDRDFLALVNVDPRSSSLIHSKKSAPTYGGMGTEKIGAVLFLGALDLRAFVA